MDKLMDKKQTQKELAKLQKKAKKFLKRATKEAKGVRKQAMSYYGGVGKKHKLGMVAVGAIALIGLVGLIVGRKKKVDEED